MKSTDQKLHEQVMGLCWAQKHCLPDCEYWHVEECTRPEFTHCIGLDVRVNPSYTTDTPKGCYFDLLQKVKEPGLWNAFYEGYITVTYDALPKFKPTFAMWLFMLMTDTHRGSEAIAEFFCKED